MAVMSGYPLRAVALRVQPGDESSDGEAASLYGVSGRMHSQAGCLNAFFAKVFGMSYVACLSARVLTAHPAKILMYGSTHRRYGCNNASVKSAATASAATANR